MPDKKRVVFVLSAYSLGGTERQLAALIERRPPSADGIDIHTITFLPPESPELVRRFEAAGVTNHLVMRRGRRFPAFFVELQRTVTRLRPAAVTTLLDASTGAWGRLAAWLARVPVILHSDQSLMVGDAGVHRRLRPFLDRITTRFLPNAHAIAARLAGNGVARERISVIPTAVDLGQFRLDVDRSARDAWGVPEDATVAGFLGRFHPVKRLDVLLDAVLALPEGDRPDVLALAGDGPVMPEVRRRVEADPWLRAHCRLLGEIHAIPEFMAAIDYLVLSSEIEGLPNVVLEAMAMARPVVATRVSDVPHIVEGSGLLAEPGDAASLAGAIAAMQALPRSEWRRMGRLARERIEREYDLERVSRRFWEAHMELMPAERTVGQPWGASAS